MPKANIAVVGCGRWGENLARNFHELGALNAVCDTSYKRRELMVKKYPDVRDYGSVESLLDSDVNAVAVATPASNHYKTAKQALLKGKDVFVEKPLAMNCSEGKELVELAEEQNRVLMVGHILSYHPAINELKRLINKGRLGKINYIYSNRLNLGRVRTEEDVSLSFAPHDISAILELLEEEPVSISAHNGSYITKDISDTTIMTMQFSSGVKAHIFVSWLHPYKEQKLVVVGTKAMVLFNDLTVEKLFIYPHKIEQKRGGIPLVQKAEYELIPELLNHMEPLKLECEHFIDCVRTRAKPRTDGESGLKVLRVLEACRKDHQFIHESSYIDKDDVVIGKGTRIWHFCHILGHTKIGENCNIGQNVCIGPNVVIGNNVKIQNNVSVYEGVTLEDDVFCGPSAVFTNVKTPRSHYSRKGKYIKTLVEKGATIGANATILCGVTIGRYASIGAGAVVTKDVPSYTLAYGVPAEVRSRVCHCGGVLRIGSSKSIECPDCGKIQKRET